MLLLGNASNLPPPRPRLVLRRDYACLRRQLRFMVFNNSSGALSIPFLGFFLQKLYQRPHQTIPFFRRLTAMQTSDSRWMMAIGCFVLSISAMAYGQNATLVLRPVGHDKSKALDQMPVIPPAWENMETHPVKRLPKRSAGGIDTVLQAQGLSTTAATVSSASGFNGVGLSSGYTISGEPPDTNGSVG